MRIGSLRRAAVGCCAVVLMVCMGLGFTATADERPNVILIMTDDQGYGDIGRHGNPKIQTPHLNALYDESVRLTDFHVSPTCAPTRASLMTGRYALRTGVWHTIMGRSILRADETTMADVFKANGYKTGLFGKWHLGDNYPYRPEHRGFDEVFSHGSGGVGQEADYWGNDYFDDTYFRNGVPEKAEGYCTDVWFKNAIRFIRQNKENPFFCYIPTNAPHSPFFVAEEFKAPYEGRQGIVNAAFNGMITNFDRNLGRLMNRLEAFGLKENTIVIFMTDNGTAGGVRFKANKVIQGYNASMRGQKGSPYDGGHRVPFFIRWPKGGIDGGRDMSVLSAHIDVLPTLIELCNLEAPEHKPFDGVSLKALLGAGVTPWKERSIIMDQQRIDTPEKGRNAFVMTDRWRLVKGKELYDIRRDPGQRYSIAKAYPDMVQRLNEDFNQWWASVSERFDEYVRIPLGHPEAPQVTLHSHDWHGPKVPWNHGHVLQGMEATGFWAVDIVESGEYTIEVCRWPHESGLNFGDTPEKGVALNIESVRLQVQDIDESMLVTPQDSGGKFTVQLEAGHAQLSAWLHADDGKERGAYYVYVSKV